MVDPVVDQHAKQARASAAAGDTAGTLEALNHLACIAKDMGHPAHYEAREAILSMLHEPLRSQFRTALNLALRARAAAEKIGVTA